MTAPIKVGRGGAGNFYGQADLKQLRSASSSGGNEDLEAQRPSPLSSPDERGPSSHDTAQRPAPEYAHSGRGGAGNWYSPRDEAGKHGTVIEGLPLPSSSSMPTTSSPSSSSAAAATLGTSTSLAMNDTEEKRRPGAAGGGRGGAGNIEFGRHLAEQHSREETGTELKDWKDKQHQLLEDVERDVERGLPLPQKAFLGHNK